MTMLRSIRERKGLTVSQLAARASIPTRVIAEYEEGRQAMPLNHARLIAKALWVPIEELMPPAGSTPPTPPTPSAPALSLAPAQTAPPPAVSYQAAAPVQAPTPVDTGTAPEYMPAPAPRPPRPTTSRPSHGGEGETRGVRGGPGGASGPGGPRGVRATPHPPGPISDGQLQELSRLAARLEIDQEQMEARIGKSLATLNRPEAKDWIKKLRAIADEIAPTPKARFGMWPEGHEDHEAVYLREQCDARAWFTFKLFNGEQLEGRISDFTPYTITITQGEGGNETVLRKLAIAYYRRSAPNAEMSAGGKGNMEDKSSTGSAHSADSANETQDVGMSDNALIVEGLDEEAEAAEASNTSASAASAPDNTPNDHRQPLDRGIDSDHVGEPDKPERDNMDKDRGR